MKNSIRLSYTLLNLWRQGRIDDALVYYFKMGNLTNPYLEEGKKWDEIVNTSVREYKRLPEEFDGDILVNPRAQEKWEAEYSDMFTVVGVPDIIDEDTLYEIKTGSSKDSAEYASDFQVALYLWLAQKNNIPIRKAYIIRYNQYNKTVDRTLIWNSEFEIERAVNYIESLAPEIYDYFESHNLFTHLT